MDIIYDDILDLAEKLHKLNDIKGFEGLHWS